MKSQACYAMDGSSKNLLQIDSLLRIKKNQLQIQYLQSLLKMERGGHKDNLVSDRSTTWQVGTRM